MASHAFVKEVLDFCFLGGGEGEGVAEVVFDFGAGWLLLLSLLLRVCHFGYLVCFFAGVYGGDSRFEIRLFALWCGAVLVGEVGRLPGLSEGLDGPLY